MRALLILCAVIALPIAEIWLTVQLVHALGAGTVLIVGAVLLGLGLAMLGRASRAWSHAITKAQADPGFAQTGFGAAMGDAALLFVGGLLLVLPGFITGAFGLLLVFPPTRKLVRRFFGTRIDSAAAARGYQRVTIIEGETVTRSTTPDEGEPSSGAGPRVISGEIVSRPTDGDADASG